MIPSKRSAEEGGFFVTMGVVLWMIGGWFSG
jgi:hypothetical protein